MAVVSPTSNVVVAILQRGAVRRGVARQGAFDDQNRSRAPAGLLHYTGTAFPEEFSRRVHLSRRLSQIERGVFRRTTGGDVPGITKNSR